ncbi:hypothetical protein HMPREF9120_02304 [Neisseria sp. oral taxon 020 str. F0370]|nr:hypothetical protein HMPREF9120_02304 [Neisseria sp. oral taxon 020 str. F0370]
MRPSEKSAIIRQRQTRPKRGFFQTALSCPRVNVCAFRTKEAV